MTIKEFYAEFGWEIIDLSVALEGAWYAIYEEISGWGND